ncbi:unnamed protein product [Sphagnum balticum]
MFLVQFTIPSGTTVNANNDGTTYSRIYIEFPTVDSNGGPLFANNLGGYTVTGEMMGCFFFFPNSSYVTAATGRLQCRMILSEVTGDPVRVEVINHNAFSGSSRYMMFYIAKVFNPAVAVTSVPISLRIDHISVANNAITKIFYDTFDLFLNSQPPATANNQNLNCDAYTGQILYSGQVNGQGWFRFYPYLASGSVSNGYWYVLDVTNDFKPLMQSPSYCYGSATCMYMPEINYLAVYTFYQTPETRMYVQFPPAISQTTTYMIAKVWYQSRFVGFHTINFDTNCWNNIIGQLNSMSLSTSSNIGWDPNMGAKKI